MPRETFRNTAPKGSPAKFFGTARQKNWSKNRDITLLSIKIFGSQNRWHPKVFPYDIFRHCGTKIFQRKILILPLPLIQKLFRYQKSSETQHRRDPLRNVLVLRHKTKSTKNRDITILSKENFDTRNQWHPKWFRYEFCRHCDTKKFSKENLDTSPSVLSINQCATRKFVKHSTGWSF